MRIYVYYLIKHWLLRMSLRDVLIDDSWTPLISSTINNDIEHESITYYFSDSSTKILGFEEFARDFIGEVDARLDIDFIEASTNNNTTIDFYNRDWTNADGNTLGRCTWYSIGFITSETFVRGVERYSFNSYNTFVHELGHALGLGEPGFDLRWDQDDTAMSYNSNDFGNYRTSFAPEDWSALESLWGIEDFIKIGDSNSNTLLAQRGAVHADSIDGKAGSDVLRGFGGKDTLIGGLGDDLIYGGWGGDRLYGGSNNDTIYASRGSDYIVGDLGNDDIYAGQGADTIIGGAGADIIRGGGGPNDIDAGDDSSRDEIYVFADVQINGRPDDGSFADILRNIDSSDHIYILGSNSSGTLGFSEDGNQINIFHNGAHEASILHSDLTIDQVQAITSIA